MSGSMSRNKGQRGEREFASLIQEWSAPVITAVGTEFALEMKRNLQQTREGGHDLVGIPWLAVEVKRQENLALPAWWRQTVEQAERVGAIPFLAYRQNRTPWRFRVEIVAAHYGPAGGGTQRLTVDMDTEGACKWFQGELYWRLQQAKEPEDA